MSKEQRRCVFCDSGWDDLDHYVDECKEVRDWFIKIDKDKKERIENIWGDRINEEKGRIIMRLGRKRDKAEEENRGHGLMC